MNGILLLIHILGAVVIYAVIGFALLSAFKNWSSYYEKLFITLALGLVLQVITGVLLELTSLHPALFVTFCSKILFYVGSVVVTQYVLARKMQKLSFTIPYKVELLTLITTLLSVGGVGTLVLLH